MTTPIADLPDYNALADRFDRFLPLIQPVSEALLSHLPDLAHGAQVLDVSCGTGEPGITLASRQPHIQVLGIDAAAAMIGVARTKAARQSLPNVRFEVMSSDHMSVPDGSMDALVSRFGLLMFGDVPASARETVRVLRPSGAFSIAAWDATDRNTLFNTTLTTLRSFLPAGARASVEGLQHWAEEGLRMRLLKDAGMSKVESQMFDWNYTFENFDSLWVMVSTMASFTGQSTLSTEAEHDFKIALYAALGQYAQSSGGYVIPHGCRIIWGRR
jgi:ubiquinone/menaquinone biosynthesis C-methylase UbiE